MSNTTGARKPTSPSIISRRKEMKYTVDTTSTTASGFVPIKGANKFPEEPNIFFTREAWVKQCHLVKICNKEVGWFALVEFHEESNSFIIFELVIPKQEVTHVETAIGKEDLADAATELIEAGKDTSKMYAWFHSHVNMGVSPSGQDEYQVEDFLEDLADQPEIPAFIRGIQNKAGALKLDVYYIQQGIAYQNLDYEILEDDDPAWKTTIENEVKAKVTEVSYYTGGARGHRQQTGKRQSNAAKNANENNWRRQEWGWAADDPEFAAYYAGYPAYNEKENDFATDDEVAETIVPLHSSLNPDCPLPRPVILPQYAEFDMDHVYTAGQIDVYMDLDGKLWVHDSAGDFYDYMEFTEAFGEIGEGFTVRHGNTKTTN